MCLVLEDKTKHIACEDIVVYKVVSIHNSEMHAIWQFYNYKYNKLHVLKTELHTYKTFSGDIITLEGFYSFGNFSSAQELHLRLVNMYGTKVVKCILPKGTEYYANNDIVVSNQIKIIEDVLHNK